MTDAGAARPGPFALVVHATIAIVAGLVAFTAAAGVIDSMPIATVAAIGAAAGAGWRSVTHAGLAAQFARVPRTYRLAFTAGVLATLIQLAFLTAVLTFGHTLASVLLVVAVLPRLAASPQAVPVTARPATVPA